MATDEEFDGVKDVGVSYVGSNDSEDDEDESDPNDETDTQLPSPEAETEGEDESDEDSDKPDELVKPRKVAVDETIDTKSEEDDDGLKPVPGETPKERAMRKEITRLRALQRGDRVKDVVNTIAPKTEKVSRHKEVLDKYKPEDLQGLREVFPALAEEMGFIRKEDMEADNYVSSANAELEKFMEEHTEYLPENDPDEVLWGRFREEFEQYKTPTDAKGFRRLFNKIHKDIFDIQPVGKLSKEIAAREIKVKTASHAGSSDPAATKRSAVKTVQASGGLRLDMLKGFSDDELSEMTGE